MSRRIPRNYRKPLSEKKFTRTVRGRIHLDTERAFVEECFVAAPDGTRTLRDDLSKEEAKRLKAVVRDIKKNRGLLRMGRIAIPLGIVLAAILFNVLFLDRLATNTARSALERVFEARVDIEALDIQPLNGRASVASLRIADRDAPMTNIVEFGDISLAISIADLVLGRVIIDEVRAGGLAFGTERTVSGALSSPASPADGDATRTPDGGVASRAQDGAAAVTDALGLGAMQEMIGDPTAEIDRVIDSLSVTTVAPAAIAEAEEAAVEIERRISAVGEQSAEVGRSVSQLASVDPAAIRSPADAAAIVTDIDATRASLDAARTAATETQQLIATEIAAVRAAEARIRDAAATDLAAARAQIPDLSVDPAALAEQSVAAFAAGFLGESWTTVQRLLAVAERVRAQSRARSAERDATSRRGRGVDVPFGNALPRLLIREIAADGTDSAGVTLAALLQAISSDPDLIAAPTSLGLSRTSPADAAGTRRELTVDATLDARAAADAPFRASFSQRGGSTPLPPTAAALGFSGLDGALALTGETVMDSEGQLTGSMSAIVTEPALRATPDASPVVAVLSQIISAEDAITADVAFTANDAGITSLSVETSLADALRGQLDGLIAEARAQAEARIAAEIERIAEEQVAALVSEISVLNGLSDRSLAELAEIETYRNELAAVETEINDQLAAVRDEAEAATRAATEAARREAEAAAAAADAAAREAEAAARESAEAELRDQAAQRGIRVPGFGN